MKEKSYPMKLAPRFLAKPWGGRRIGEIFGKPLPDGEPIGESWEFFDRLLEDSHVVCTPGAGFGAAGEGYARLSAFNSAENVAEAIRRIEKAFGG